MEFGGKFLSLWGISLTSCFLLLQEDLTLLLNAFILSNSIILTCIGRSTLFVELLEPHGKIFGSSDDLLELI